MMIFGRDAKERCIHDHSSNIFSTSKPPDLIDMKSRHLFYRSHQYTIVERDVISQIELLYLLVSLDSLTEEFSLTFFI